MSTLPKPVGEDLRRARVQAGLEITDVAAHLRIRSNFLSALEEGRPDALPGLTYAIGYVRTYAGFLGLDPDAAVRRFKEEAAGINAKPQLVFPSPAPEGRVPGLLLMLVAAMLAGGAFGGWYWLSERDGDLRGLVPSVPERLAQLIEGDAPPAISTSPAAAPTGEAASPKPVPVTAAPAAGSYAEANPTGVAVPQPRTTAATPHNAPAPAAPQRAVESAVAAGSATRPAATTAPAPAATAPATASPAPTAPATTAPVLVAPAPAVAAQVPASPAGTASAAPAAVPVAAPTTAAATASETPADGTPDVTAPPESTAAGSQSVPGAPPIVAAARPADASRDVPAAPRIAGLIGSSEAAVPSGRAVGSVDRVMIRATGDSWVQVRDAQGTALFTRVLREGDVYRVPDQGGLRLATGNAGALEILVDGTPAPSLGGFGEVVRNVLLDPTRLSAGTAAGANR